MSCLVKGCKTTRRLDHEVISVHTFPKDLDSSLAKSWFLAAGLDSKYFQWSKNKGVCSKHFFQEDFIGRNRLKSHAVPSLNLPTSLSETSLSSVKKPSAVDSTTPPTMFTPPYQLTRVPTSQLPEFLKSKNTGGQPLKVVVVKSINPPQSKVMQMRSSSKQPDGEIDSDPTVKTEDVDPLEIGPSMSVEKKSGNSPFKIVTRSGGIIVVKSEKDTSKSVATTVRPNVAGGFVAPKVETETLGVEHQPYPIQPKQPEIITVDIIDSDEENTEETEEMEETDACTNTKCLRYNDPKNCDIDEPILENPDLIFLKRLFKLNDPTDKDLANVKLVDDKSDTESTINLLSDSDSEEEPFHKVFNKFDGTYKPPKIAKPHLALRKNANPRSITEKHLESVEFAPICFSIVRTWVEKNMTTIKESEVVLEELIEERENIQDKIKALKMEEKILEQKREILSKRKRKRDGPETDDTTKKSRKENNEDDDNIQNDDDDEPDENINENPDHQMTDEDASLDCEETLEDFDEDTAALEEDVGNCQNLTEKVSVQDLTAEEHDDLDLLLESEKAIVALNNQMSGFGQ